MSFHLAWRCWLSIYSTKRCGRHVPMTGGRPPRAPRASDRTVHRGCRPAARGQRRAVGRILRPVGTTPGASAVARARILGPSREGGPDRLRPAPDRSPLLHRNTSCFLRQRATGRCIVSLTSVARECAAREVGAVIPGYPISPDPGNLRKGRIALIPEMQCRS